MNYENIKDELYINAYHRRDIAQTKARAEYETVQKTHEAYMDGVDDAIRAIERLLQEAPVASPVRDIEPEVVPKKGLCRVRCMTVCYIGPTMLKAAIRESQLDKLIGPFDEIDIPLDNGRTVTVVCGYSDSNMARFVFKDCWDDHAMNEENTNETGYYGSDARRHVLEDIYPHLPQAWKDIIYPRLLSEVINGETVEYRDPLWLPSATDVFGSSVYKWWQDEPNSFQLPIFERGRDRVKECGDDGVCHWWLRSVIATNTTYFCCVYTSGAANYDNAVCSHGFAPGFDI